ncbi:MAG: hypothetical protein H6755_05550 [Candidatus Omnitrophica bacterium]|nr:hypothetical protein [Candidatus Omnitrophota bacterium]
MYKLKLTVLALISLAVLNTGCSVFMAAKQPEKKNLKVLSLGTPRTHVIAELGAPEYSEEKNGIKVDIFSFQQGYSKGAKVGRAFFHGTADIFSLGLWEVIGTPVEAIADGKQMKIEIIYDEDDKVVETKYLHEELKQSKVEN